MFRLILLSLFLVYFSTNAVSQTYTPSQKSTIINGKKYWLHKVEKGQSLYGIAKLYNTDLNALILENPGGIDGIKPGHELKIPAEKAKTQTTVADLDKYIVHNVVKNETVFSI